MTEKARHFCNDTNSWPFPDVKVYSDEEEWGSWQKRGDPVLHIDLTKWAEILLIAPLDANTMAKIANGICDNMLTCAVRAWDLSKPLLFCPAMNTKMWEHPITAQHVGLLKSWGYHEIPCIAKLLMCGDTGLGAMAEPQDIVSTVAKHGGLIVAKKSSQST
ncbi:hypothetical protein GE061_010338 [Apolygus lucorum]|uniref:Flavoprotein domain-containing protein n=1 Tax=Apolygus lucorum TaxID=248454 RepID=A0A8S9Y2R3_APOLU|nr:hypothetical protein GE061_010338 [Apolygus lucorum]